MILRPQADPAAAATAVIPAWEAIAARQRRVAPSYLLVTQVEHARLSGELAGRFDAARVGKLPEDAVRAIAMHDGGWAGFDAPQGPARSAAGKPVSFLDVPPQTFIPAWLRSIEQADLVSPLAGLMVSGHFSRLAASAPEVEEPSQEKEMMLEAFREREQRRQQQLFPLVRLSPGEVERLVDVLQFCDLLSLYLCCGSQHPVEFPQPLLAGKLADRKVRATWQEGRCRLEPSPFAAGVEFEIEAWRYPAPADETQTRLCFHLQ